MEEILASIRKIISEDSTEPQAAVPAAAPQPAMQAEADVLELTHEIEEVVPAPAPQPAPVQAAAPAPEPVLPKDDIVFESIEEPPPAKPVAQAQVHSSEGLVSERAQSAVDDALSDLDFGSDEPHVAQSVAPIDGRSVEAVFDRAVRETFDPVLRAWLHEQTEVIVERMKPAIREWLDDNLPAMLKSAVEAEVARAVKARSTKR